MPCLVTRSGTLNLQSRLTLREAPANPKRAIAMRTILPLLFLTGLTAVAPAQRKWVVDANGGIGHDFLDIAPAVDAATDGDTIFVLGTGRTYRMPPLSKGVSIVGFGNPRLSNGGMSISNIGAGKALAVTGFTLDFGMTLGLSQCAGTVLLRRLDSMVPGLGMDVNRCAAVSVSDCRISGHGPSVTEPSAVTVRDSSLYFTDCVLVGDEAFPPVVPAASGLLASRSRVVLNRCAVAGGRRLNGPVDLAPAIRTEGSIVVVTGRSSLVGAGTLAIDGNNSGSVIDPGATLFGGIGARVTVVVAQVPASSAAPYVTTDSVTLRYDGQVGDLVAQSIGLLQQPVVSALGEEWVQRAGLLVVDVGVLATSAPRLVNVPLPARGVLTGLQLASQALVLRGRTLTWSTPATFLLE